MAFGRGALARSRPQPGDIALPRRIALGVPETLLAGERRAALNAAVDALAEPDREILLRRYYFGQKPREIAAALGLDKKQVDNRLYQTKRRLRASVTGAEGE